MSRLSANKAIISTENGNKILLGIRFTLPKTNISKENTANYKGAVKYIQDNYFNKMGHNGFFRLLPESHKSLACYEYLDLNTFVNQSVIDKSVEIKDDLCSVDILLGQYDYEDGIQKELVSTCSELNAFVTNNFATKWHQFSLN